MIVFLSFGSGGGGISVIIDRSRAGEIYVCTAMDGWISARARGGRELWTGLRSLKVVFVFFFDHVLLSLLLFLFVSIPNNPRPFGKHIVHRRHLPHPIISVVTLVGLGLEKWHLFRGQLPHPIHRKVTTRHY